MNEPSGGGSFYLQSKVVSAKNRIEMEFDEMPSAQKQINDAADAAEKNAERKKD